MCVKNKAFALKKQALQRERNESTLLLFYVWRVRGGLIHLCILAVVPTKGLIVSCLLRLFVFFKRREERLGDAQHCMMIDGARRSCL